MSEASIIGKQLYQHLGKLFFAVAIADKSVHTKEIDKLRSFIRKYWLDVDAVEDEYGEDAAFQIESVFDWLLEYEKDATICFEEFEEFYKEHRRRFTQPMKTLILDTAHAIAHAVSGKNKSELILLGKLGLLLDS